MTLSTIRKAVVISDPLEAYVAGGMDRAGIRYFHEKEPENTTALDFFLPDDSLYIEVKAMHAERVGKQMEQAQNVIVLQGYAAATWFVEMLDMARSNLDDGR